MEDPSDFFTDVIGLGLSIISNYILNIYICLCKKKNENPKFDIDHCYYCEGEEIFPALFFQW